MRHPSMLWLSLAALATLTALPLSACNTMSGMGEDISEAGQGLDRTSERTQEKLSGKEKSSSDTYQAGHY